MSRKKKLAKTRVFTWITALFVATSLVLGLATPSIASTDRASVRVTGDLTWPETWKAISTLRSYGVPIRVGPCAPGPRCVVVTHYTAADGLGGMTTGWTGNATVRLNGYYLNSHYARLEASIHELSHASGLWDHAAPCTSSLEPVLAQCGYWMIGLTGAEQQKLKEIWG